MNLKIWFIFSFTGSTSIHPYSYPHPPSGFYPASQFPNAAPQPIQNTGRLIEYFKFLRKFNEPLKSNDPGPRILITLGLEFRRFSVTFQSSGHSRKFSHYHSVGRFSRRQTVDMFLLSPETRLWCFMQIVSWNVKVSFLRKIRRRALYVQNNY